MFFHHIAPAAKASLPEAFLIEKAALLFIFYGPQRSKLYESDSGPLVPYLPDKISCLFISGGNLFC